MKFISTVLLITAGMMILVSCGNKESDVAEEKVVVKAIDPVNMDDNVVPGNNFYEYANGGWIKAHPLPEEYSRYGAFNELQDANYEALRTIFEAAASEKDAAKGSMTQKIGDFYASGMDTNAINEAGYKPIIPYLKEIDEATNHTELWAIIGKFHRMQIAPLFYIYAGQDEKNSENVIAQFYQGGIGLPDRDYYLSDEASMKAIRDGYKQFIVKLFTLIGNDEAGSNEVADKIIAFETELAKSQMDRVERRDPHKTYNKFDFTGLSKLTPAFDWNVFFDGVNLNAREEFNVAMVDFMKAASDIYKKSDIETLKNYLKFNLLNTAAPYLNDDFVNTNFDFYGKVLSGQKKIRPRWKRVLSNTSGELGELVGQLFVKEYFPPRAKGRMLELVGNLRYALGKHIGELDWMVEDTKKKALEKLNKMSVKIGYPDKWRSYDDLEIGRNSYFDNVIAASVFNFDYSMAKAGKKVDKAEWHMTPQTVNAYYNPTLNEIVFPAAILQPPFFNMDADDAVNYGAIGAVIGHEMTHGFDDQGREYDVNGNLANWWTEEDAKNFNKKTQVLVKQFSEFNPIDTLHLNGEFTLGENIADLGGVTVSLTALEKALENSDNKEIDGLTPIQRYFLSFAQVWRNNIADEELRRRIQTDVHSPGKYRVNGTLPNIDAFYTAFNIKEGDKMYRPKEERAKIW